VDRTTTYASATRLTAAIQATDIATKGFAAITVFNPTPGGGTSGALTIAINPLANPVISITSISPASATAGGPAFVLTVTGSNFVSGSKVRWNGVDRVTSYTSSSKISAYIPASDIRSAGTGSVTVFNPTSGGISNPMTFTIVPAPTAVNMIKIS
jgi:hypothetical protein